MGQDIHGVPGVYRNIVKRRYITSRLVLKVVGRICGVRLAHDILLRYHCIAHLSLMQRMGESIFCVYILVRAVLRIIMGMQTICYSESEDTKFGRNRVCPTVQ